MANGTVKWFSNKKGYGFITPDEGDKDIFVHYSAIHIGEGEFASLNQDDKVEYEVVETEKGLEARDVVITEKAPFQPRRKRENY